MKANQAILLLCLPLTIGLSAKAPDSRPNNQESNRHERAPTPSTTLSSQLKEIAGSSKMSKREQEHLISSKVLTAVTNAIHGINDSDKALKVALELAEAAAKAAPQFAEEIAEAIKSSPAFSRIKGAAQQISEAVRQGKDESGEPDTAHPDRNHDKKHKPKHDHGGHCDDPVVSPSR